MEAIVEWAHTAIWLTPGRLMLIGFWVLICAASAALLLSLRTDFVRSKPIYKYAVLSAVAHIVLIALATTIDIVTPAAPGRDGDVVWFELTGGDETATSPTRASPSSETNTVPSKTASAGHPTSSPPMPSEQHETITQSSFPPHEATAAVVPTVAPTRQSPPEANTGSPGPMRPHPEIAAGLPDPLRVTDVSPHAEASTKAYPVQPIRDGPSLTEAVPPTSAGAPASIDVFPAIEIVELPAEPIVRPAARSPTTSTPGVRVPPIPNTESASVLPVRQPTSQIGESRKNSVPELYRLRFDPDKLALAERYGADERTERAVRRALAWLVSQQEPDGSWDPVRHGAGKETYTLGKDRNGAGAHARSGITALALLAFLGAGHTHKHDGPYRSNVAAAVDFLVRSQAPQGHLAGRARVYEFMYCHAMATLALAEAYGMTGDPALEVPVRRAVGFTLSAQDPRGGGWRYRPGDPGDTSQLGWQLMSLRSARLAGIAVPADTFTKAERFLKNVRAGGYGGLASYRPGEPVSPAMTAEALVCRQLLGESISTDTLREADAFILQHRPGTGEDNLYFWYYATMALYYQQGEAWATWNRALKEHLLAMQADAGSWPSNTTWGSYGGTVYSTATATLCLEVYYRYLPMYVAVPETNSVFR